MMNASIDSLSKTSRSQEDEEKREAEEQRSPLQEELPTTKSVASLSGFGSINEGQPGAVAVSGTTGGQSRRVRNNSTVSFEGDTVFTIPQETTGRTAEAQQQHQQDNDVQLVSAETVDNDAIMAQAVSDVISQAAQAELVVNERTNKRRKSNFVALGWLIVIVALIVVGVSFGITLLSRDDKGTTIFNNEQQQQVILAQVEASDPNSLDFFSAQASLVDNGNGELVEVATGFYSSKACYVVPCYESGYLDCDLSRFYEPGCCIGDDCLNEANRCGAICPSDPWPCRFEPAECRSIGCLQCDAVDGEEIYDAREILHSIDCLSYGTKTLPTTSTMKNQLSGQDVAGGIEYNWAIACGPSEWENLDDGSVGRGEYACFAYRSVPSGIYLFNVTKSLWVPCQYIQMMECGCGVLDPLTIPGNRGPKDPKVGWKPCLTTEDCPYLCHDAGTDNAKSVCHAFSEKFKHGIDWWEGENYYNFDVFAKSGNYEESNTEILIFDVEG